MKTLKTILVEYAQSRGGGLPLTAEEICNAVVLWAQQYFSSASAGINVTVEEVDGKLVISVQDSALANYLVNNFEASQGSLEVDGVGNNGYDITINEEWLKTFIENFVVGSETVVVDYDEDNQKLEIHLDYTVIQKLERAILLPVDNPSEESVPVVDVDGSYGYTPLSELGGGTKLYRHKIYSQLTFVAVEFVSTSAENASGFNLNEELKKCLCSHLFASEVYKGVVLNHTIGTQLALYYYNKDDNAISSLNIPLTGGYTHDVTEL